MYYASAVQHNRKVLAQRAVEPSYSSQTVIHMTYTNSIPYTIVHFILCMITL
jgi:hypothetical protein